MKFGLLYTFKTKCQIRSQKVFQMKGCGKPWIYQPTVLKIHIGKWKWIELTLRKPTGLVEKMALDWNPEETWNQGCSRTDWMRTIEKEALKLGKTLNEVNRLATDKNHHKHFSEVLCSRRRKRNWWRRPNWMLNVLLKNGRIA